MTEGPYRDLGSGFARLTGSEAPRRAPSRISSVEDVLLELLRNARDAGAKNVFVASTLRARRYRALTVTDDGHGVPEAYRETIFEPGVTTRHLSTHGAGLALHHIKNAALQSALVHASSPTSVKVVLDTRHIQERSLQSASRPSQTNLLATVHSFAKESPNLRVFHDSPAKILASLIENHIINMNEDERLGSHRGGGSTSRLVKEARRVGLGVSSKTGGRVLRGEVRAAKPVAESVEVSRVPPEREVRDGASGGGGSGGSVLGVGEEERGEISSILSRLARRSFLEVGEVKVSSRPGEVWIRAAVHEPEDEYE